MARHPDEIMMTTWEKRKVLDAFKLAAKDQGWSASEQLRQLLRLTVEKSSGMSSPTPASPTVLVLAKEEEEYDAPLTSFTQNTRGRDSGSYLCATSQEGALT